MANYIAIIVFVVGFFVNFKLIDHYVYNNAEIEELEYEDMFRKVIPIISAILYILGVISLLFSNLTDNQKLIGALLFNMLFVVSIIDVMTCYIFDNVWIAYGAMLIILKLMLGELNIFNSALLVLIGGGIYGIIYVVSRLIYKREAFGLGDVCLIAVISAIMSFDNIMLTLFSPFYIAPVFILINWIINRKRPELNAEIPFGPYICLGAWITYLYGDVIMNWYFSFTGL